MIVSVLLLFLGVTISRLDPRWEKQDSTDTSIPDNGEAKIPELYVENQDILIDGIQKGNYQEDGATVLIKTLPVETQAKDKGYLEVTADKKANEISTEPVVVVQPVVETTPEEAVAFDQPVAEVTPEEPVAFEQPVAEVTPEEPVAFEHSLPVPYAPPGKDATLAGDIIDFKFLNSTDFPILINSQVQQSKVIVSIFGHREGATSRLVKIETERVVNKASREYIEQANLAPGQVLVQRPGRDGYRLKTYEVTLENGKEVQRQLISENVVEPESEIIAVGPKINTKGIVKK
ncbi:G5 domain-containing protein [Desulforamulus ferrireducens]|uniref:G5 domain-containing protein n=1 Tax=Desulforamulus ferrireducens TaxID=1833852 RepID=UPI001EE3BFBD|nr:G5 domain-containing protein [Desulforamulus ferrireducens]